MIVPQYWAEARQQHRQGKRQLTVRRFGWSDESQQAAQQHADERVRDAMSRLQAGEPLARREPKVPYNGADGLPIREEIVRRDGDSVITRNSYGALCLNNANVLFADVDFERAVPGRAIAGTLLAVVALVFTSGLAGMGWGWAFALLMLGLLLSYPLANAAYRGWLAITGGAEQRVRRRIRAFSGAHPDWHLRVYRTPAGFRILAMHAIFDPAGDDVAAFFQALNTDPLYQQMCRNQRCFRARVSAKPWRIGISQHMRPRPGIWPVAAERLPERNRWLAEYDAAASRFAACQFVERLGSQQVHPAALAVSQLHDTLCRSDSALPLA